MNLSYARLTLIVLLALAAGAAAMVLLGQAGDQPGSPASTAEPEPLYWVAPMDPNYRRDQPGKSPMGMDLIPVYADGVTAGEGPGTISISPDVVNNLGVRTARASLRALHSEIRTVGYVQFDLDRLVHIHPRVEGWIDTLHVTTAGTPVRKGEPLYSLYSPQLVNAQEELLLALNRGNERLVEAAVERLQALQMDDEFIRQLRSSRKVGQTVTFTASQDGVIDSLEVREGFFVQPGTTLMSIGNLDQVWVEAEVFERQAMLMEPGLPVTMSLDYLPGRRWDGTVDFVYPTLDAATRTARLRLRFDNSDGQLKPNMFAQVLIHAHADESSLTVPREAVIRTGRHDRVVLALGDGRFKSVAVGLGRMDENWAEITSGLEAGEEVVQSAQFLLDSESSKTSDFMRLNHDAMDHGDMDHSNMNHAEMDHGTMDHGAHRHD